ncbi:MAG: glycine oxidase ThiO [Terriglobia bacterium]
MAADSNSPRTADVIVIGGGLIGSAVALRLAQARLRVCVLDRGQPGAEASTAAAGMLAPQGEMVNPDAFFEFCAASRDLYPDFVNEIEELSGTNVGYRRDGTLLVAITDAECKELEAVHRVQSGLGLPIEKLARRGGDAIHGRVKGLSKEIRAALFIPGDHWIDNERLTLAAINACRKLGVVFCPGRPVTRFNVKEGRVESVEAAYIAGGASTLAAEHFVLAAGCWSCELVAPLGIKLRMEPCHGQMMEFEADEDLPLVVRAGHHYLVPRAGKRVLAGTTAEYIGFNKAVTGGGLRSILEGTGRFTPFVKGLRFRRAWSGLRPDTEDHLPILGRGEIPNLYFATGHFRNGILLAPITAQVISELILGKPAPFPLEGYSPARFLS